MSNLRTRVEHFYGSQERYEIELVKLRLDTNGLDEKEALENGWLYYKNEWYPCRSTRLEIARWKPKPETLPDHCQISLIKEPTPHLKQIYQEFLKIKGFRNLNNPFCDKVRQQYLVVTDGGTPVAFTRFNHYNGGIESQFTAWNYHNPKLSIGRKIISYEVAYAASLGFDYLYIGQGYEHSSTYKASLHGFQWWTGDKWSTDQQMYRDLCARDSKVRSIRDLAAIYSAD